MGQADPLLLSVGSDRDLSSGDSRYTAGGHPLMVAGLAQWHQRMDRLLRAAPGSILGLPDLGAGMDGLVGQPLTAQAIATAQGRAQQTIARDSRVQAVASVAISPAPQDPTTIFLDASVVLDGTPRAIRWMFGS